MTHGWKSAFAMRLTFPFVAPPTMNLRKISPKPKKNRIASVIFLRPKTPVPQGFSDFSKGYKKNKASQDTPPYIFFYEGSVKKQNDMQNKAQRAGPRLHPPAP